jgi:hypothetical protein
MSRRIELYQQWKYPIIIGLLLFSLVFSKWLLTVVEFLLVLTVLIDNNSRKRLLKSFTSPLVLSLIALFVLHVVGLLWTQDFDYAGKDLKNKVPLLFFPILFYAAGTLDLKTARRLLLMFAGFVLLLPIFTLLYHLLVPNSGTFVAYGQSHIRFSLLICLAVYFILYFRNQDNKIFKISARIIHRLHRFLSDAVFCSCFALEKNQPNMDTDNGSDYSNFYLGICFVGIF